MLASIRKYLLPVVGLALSAGILIYLFQYTSLSEVIQLIREVDKALLVLFVLCSLTMSLFRTWRYQLLLHSVHWHAPRVALFLIVLVRNFCSDLLPARLGTLVYVALIRGRLGIPMATATSTFAIAFLFDIIALAPLILVVVALEAARSLQGDMFIIGGAGFLFTIFAGFLLAFLPTLTRFALSLLEKMHTFPYRGKIQEFLEEALQDLRQIRERGVYPHVLLLSLAVRILKYLGLFLFLYALLKPQGIGFDDFAPSSAFLGMFAAELAASLPISGFAGFGVYEGVWAYTFSLLGFAKELAALTAIAHHLFTQVYGYSLGAGALALLFILRWQKAHSIPSFSRPTALRFAARFAALILLPLVPLAGLTAFAAAPQQKSDHEEEKTFSVEKSVLRQLPFSVVFDSNRSDSFGIYLLDKNTGEIEPLVDTPVHEMYPDPSPDGKTIVYSQTHTTSRFEAGEIMLFERGTRQSKLLTKNGVFPTFSQDGKSVYFERQRKAVMQLDLHSGEVRRLFPPKNSPFQRFQIVKPRVSPDSRLVAFTSNRRGDWGAWYAELQSGKAFFIDTGCEPTWTPDGQGLVYVSKAGSRGGSGLKLFNLATKSSQVLWDEQGPFGREYFPTSSPLGTWFSASTPEKHSHLSAPYNLFFLSAGPPKALQLTQSAATDRWPKPLNWQGYALDLKK